MKRVCLTILITVVCLSLQAQESQTAYNFLRIPISAHAAALGGDCNSIIEDDLTLIYNNPALLSSVSDRTISLAYSNYMSSVNYGAATFNRAFTQKASGAVGVQYINYGKMKEVDENNVETGEFSASELAANIVFSYTLWRDIVGAINLKTIYSHIASYNSLAVGVDLGLNYYNPDLDLSVSAVAKNLGGQVKAYDDEYDKMPFDLQIGASKGIAHTPFRISASLVDLTDWDYKFINHLTVGIDALLSEQFYIAAGYNFRRKEQMKITTDDDSSSHMAGLSLGAGLALERFNLNLAYAKYHVSGSSIMINLGIKL